MDLYLTCIGIGCAMGFFSGLLGVGGGIIAVPAMMHFLKMNSHQAMGTSLAVIIAVAISGSLKHYSAGNITPKVALLIAIGGIAFGYVGAYVNTRMDPFILKRVFAIFIIVIGAKMLLEPKPQAESVEKPAEALSAENSTPVRVDDWVASCRRSLRCGKEQSNG